MFRDGDQMRWPQHASLFNEGGKIIFITQHVPSKLALHVENDKYSSTA